MACFVSEKLTSNAEIYNNRNEIYGGAYKNVGLIMAGLFPNGLSLNSTEDFNRFGCLHTIASKLCRYSNIFHLGGHQDSLDDISVYAAMLQELDNE